MEIGEIVQARYCPTDVSSLSAQALDNVGGLYHFVAAYRIDVGRDRGQVMFVPCYYDGNPCQLFGACFVPQSDLIITSGAKTAA